MVLDQCAINAEAKVERCEFKHWRQCSTSYQSGWGDQAPVSHRGYVLIPLNLYCFVVENIVYVGLVYIWKFSCIVCFVVAIVFA